MKSIGYQDGGDTSAETALSAGSKYNQLCYLLKGGIMANLSINQRGHNKTKKFKGTIIAICQTLTAKSIIYFIFYITK